MELLVYENGGYLNNIDNDFAMFQVIFFLILVCIIGSIVVSVFKDGAQWNKNNQSPKLQVGAVVVSKRGDVQTYRYGKHRHRRSSTTYYVTFEVDNGDRMELMVPDQEYGMLVEGDLGTLEFQGTRYWSFRRNR